MSEYDGNGGDLHFKKKKTCDATRCVLVHPEHIGGVKETTAMQRAIAVFLGTVELEYRVQDPSSPPPMITEKVVKGSLVDPRR